MSRADFDSYMETHGNDYEAAYEHFARHDPHAPSHVKDDFRELHIETDDGERLQPDELNPSEKVEFRSEYSFYRFMGKQELAERNPSKSLWVDMIAGRANAAQLNLQTA